MAIMANYHGAVLDESSRAILDFAAKLTRTPGRMAHSDVQSLQAKGLSDRAINDVVQVASYFNYINRIADGLGVDLEPDMPPRANMGA